MSWPPLYYGINKELSYNYCMQSDLDKLTSVINNVTADILRDMPPENHSKLQLELTFDNAKRMVVHAINDAYMDGDAERNIRKLVEDEDGTYMLDRSVKDAVR